MDIRHVLVAVLLFAGLIVLVTVVERLHDAGGASQWAPRQAPRYADGTPDYAAIGAAYLAEEEGEDDPRSFCPACLAVAREMDEEMAPTNGVPELCQRHEERLVYWISPTDAASMGRVVGGMLEYAWRTTHAGEEA